MRKEIFLLLVLSMALLSCNTGKQSGKSDNANSDGEYEMSPEFIQVAKQQKLEGIFPGAKGFVVNAKGDTLVRFVKFGSAVSQH